LTLEAKKKSNLNFVNTYSELPKKFYEKKDPTPVKNPKLLKLNNNLCDFLNLDKNYFTKKSSNLIDMDGFNDYYKNGPSDNIRNTISKIDFDETAKKLFLLEANLK